MRASSIGRTKPGMRGGLGGVAAGDNMMPGFEQPLDDSAAEEAAGAGDQYGFRVGGCVIALRSSFRPFSAALVQVGLPRSCTLF